MLSAHFLATIAGKEGGIRMIKKKVTYMKTYDPPPHCGFSRNLLEDDIRMQQIGFDYAYYYKQYGQIESFFRSLPAIFSEEEKAGGLSPAGYALKRYGRKIEFISGYSLEQLSAQLNAYSICYIIHQYFESVDSPQEGDLVFYPYPIRGVHPLVGIFQKDGSVISKYSYESLYVFKHPLFFIPDFYGNVALFYRLKQKALALKIKSLPTPLPGRSIPYIIQKDYFSYNLFSRNNQALKNEIDATTEHDLIDHFPHIRGLDYIDFQGVCFDYAFGRFLNTYTVPSDLFIHTLISHDTCTKYFDVTLKPEPGDLGIYFQTGAIVKPVHWGIYLADNRIISKWGKEGVFEHPFFDTPSVYGRKLKFFKLKPGLTKEAFQGNLRLDQQGRSREEPVILSEDESGNQRLLLFSFKKLAITNHQHKATTVKRFKPT